MAKADNIRSHNGAAHLGRDGGSKRAASGGGTSGRGGKVGTSAGVQAFDGRSTKVGDVPKVSSGARPTGPDSPKGRDAGGRENLGTSVRKHSGARMSAPESGSAKARPAGVKVVDGKSTPKGVARKPK